MLVTARARLATCPSGPPATSRPDATSERRLFVLSGEPASLRSSSGDAAERCSCSETGSPYRRRPGRAEYARRGRYECPTLDAACRRGRRSPIRRRRTRRRRRARRVAARATRRRRRPPTDREFRIVADPSTGLRSATHFVGYIPTARAPDHFHTYDEVIYVLDGEGVLHAERRRGGRCSAGACIQLPARTVHCLENTGERA